MDKMKKCVTCGADIASSAKACPKCGAKNKKPVFLRGWFIMIAIIAIAGIVIGISKNIGASEIRFDSGKSFTASELKKIGNDTAYIGALCTVKMTVKEVDSLFEMIESKDGVEIRYNYANNSVKVQTLALNKGDVIEVRGRVNSIGTWQIGVDNITSIKELS